MNDTRISDELLGLAGQAAEHLGRVGALLESDAPPDVAAVEQAVAATRVLRGNASVLGLDPFQGFLGRLFQILEDVDSGETPWSGRLQAALREAIDVEARYIGALERGDVKSDTDILARADAKLAALRRLPSSEPVADTFPDPASVAALPPKLLSSSAVAAELQTAAQQLQRLRLALESQALPIAARESGLATLEHEIEKLQATLREPRRAAPAAPETAPDGLRNHCEGALHRLVEAAAQEVLEEARERGLRLGLRVTGALDPVDEGLGAALLAVLSNLWSDCLEAQSARGEMQIDTVLRSTDHRLVVEIRDDAPHDDAWRAARNDEDVLGCYPGVRRSRPLVEALHGLVDLEPEALPGCRFRLMLPLSAERPHAMLLRLGRHDVAVAASAVEGVHEAATVHPAYDAAGAFVDVEGQRVPVLHLAFLLGDVAFDELRREHVVVVGSCERRAALFASDARRTVSGKLQPEPHGLWAGTFETESGVVPLLHVGAVLGRCTPADFVVASHRGAASVEAVSRPPGVVLVLTSAALEREQLQEMLGEAGYIVRAVPSVDEAWRVLQSETVEVVISDLRLPEMFAQQIADRRRQSAEYQRVPMLLVLSNASEQSHLVVQQLGARDWMKSPVERGPVLDTVRRYAAKRA